MSMTTTARRGAAAFTIALALGAGGPAVTASATAAPGVSAVSAKAAGVQRWAGADRYEASALISRNSFDAGVAVAYVASGEKFTDALSGAPVAGKTPGPMLLVAETSIPGPIATELARLKPRKIVVLGGPSSVSGGVESQLDSYTTGEVERWMGVDRYDASAQISQHAFAAAGAVTTAYITSGNVFADALSGAPVASMTKGPMLLVDDDRIPTEIDEELRRLDAKRIVVLGGSSSVNDNVLAELTKYNPVWVDRWAGSDRYAASAAISEMSFDPGVPVAYVAFGGVFSDALSGGPVAGKDKGPMLLVKDDEIPDSIALELVRLQPRKIVILGGTNSVDTEVENQLGDYVVP